LRNSQSLEFEFIDRRPKKSIYHQDFISGEVKLRPQNITNSSTRMMTKYEDQVKDPHFSKGFAMKIKEFPSVFKKVNGEFSSY